MWCLCVRLLEEVIKVGVELWVFAGDYLGDFAFGTYDYFCRIALDCVCLVRTTILNAIVIIPMEFDILRQLISNLQNASHRLLWGENGYWCDWLCSSLW